MADYDHQRTVALLTGLRRFPYGWTVVLCIFGAGFGLILFLLAAQPNADTTNNLMVCLEVGAAVFLVVFSIFLCGVLNYLFQWAAQLLAVLDSIHESQQ